MTKQGPSRLKTLQRTACLVTATVLLLLPEQVVAQATTNQAGAQYTACMELAWNTPEEAFERAKTWIDLGGGDPANHCAAIALLGLGRFADAGGRLERLAKDMRVENKPLRAQILAQAGMAWLLAGENERAYAAQTTALELTPDNQDLWIDRSVSLAAAQNYWEAIDDLNRAAELGPPRADLLIFRASAYRYVEAPELAMEDINRALQLDPNNVEGLLERGNLRRLTGDAEGAREDWLRVTAQAPDSPAAAAARSNLEKLDVAVD